MKIEVLQENLNKALTIATRIVSSKPQLPVLTNIFLGVTNEGGTLTASNVESTIIVPFGAKIEEPGETLVPARTFQELISSLSPDKLTLEVDGNILKVKQSKFQGKIVCAPATDFPQNMPAVDSGVSWKIPGDTFLKALSHTLFSSALDEARAVLNGVLFKFGDNPMFVATDGFRLSQFKLNKTDSPSGEIDQIVVPTKALMEVVKLLSDSPKTDVMLIIAPNQVLFKIDDISFSCQVIAGNFPDFEKIIPSTFDTKIKLTTEEFTRALKTAAIFARENANIVRLVINGSELTVRAQGGEMGENETKLDIEIEKGSPEDFSVAFNFRYILDFLANLKDEKEITLELGTQTSPALFRPAKSTNYLHIIMPVRVQS